MKNLIAISCIIILYCIACRKTTGNANLDQGKELYPLTLGHTIEYMLDSTIWDDFTGTTYTNNYILKDVIDTTYIDAVFDTAYYVNRYIKGVGDSTYKFMYVYFVKSLPNQLIVTENNFKYLKLAHPLSTTDVWSGNLYLPTDLSEFNWLSGWKYKYTELNGTYTNDSSSFTQVATINQRFGLSNNEGDTSLNSPNFGTYTYSVEKYAKNVGLVYKKFTRWKKDPSIANGKRKGYEVEFRAIRSY
jgi:hypothetical protein